MKNACPFPAWRGINQFKTIFGGALVCRSFSERLCPRGDGPKSTTYWGISKQTCRHHCVNPEAPSLCEVSLSPAPLRLREPKFATDSLLLSPPFSSRAFTEVSSAAVLGAEG